MADETRFDLQGDAVTALMRSYPDELQARFSAVGKRTAERIARSAAVRLDAALGPDATGKTVQGITVEDSRDGRGYVVVARRSGVRRLPWFLDKGTKHMDPRPFFDVSATLEEGPYRRALEQEAADLAAEKGLGS